MEYSVQYKARKTLAITVNPDLSIVVTAPSGTEHEQIRTKIRKRAGWIRKAQHEFQLYLLKQPPRRYVNGESHRYLGRQYRLRARKRPENDVKCARGYFHVSTKAVPDTRLVKQLLLGWYREHAQRVFSERLAICCKAAATEGISCPEITIRTMKTRWGSCSKNGRVLLNLDLIKAPKECIDYVIMHELCHLKEHHHGPRFWRVLKRLMPDYEKRREKLNRLVEM